MNSPQTSAGDDLSLVAAMARGDERAAAALFDRHSGVMFALACRIVGERADADEVVLEAFTQAWRDAARYETSRGSVAGWLTTITRTRALDLVRARARRTKAVETATRAFVDEPVAVADNVPHAMDQLVSRERASAVNSALDVLPAAQRSAIELAFYEGLSHSEIAERLAEPLGTVKTRIRLGMLKLRDVLMAVALEGVS